NQAFLPDSKTGDVPLLAFILDNDIEALQEWDVCVAQGNGSPAVGLEFSGPNGLPVTVRKRERQFERPRPKDSTIIKVNKQRVGEIEDEKVDLPKDTIREIEEAWRLEPERKGRRVPGS